MPEKKSSGTEHLHTKVAVDHTQINKFKSLCSPERFSFLRLGFQLHIANFSGVNFTNATKMPSTEGDTANVPLKASDIITIIINSITCPFTVLLNVLVIMAVKRRQRLQTNSNILLACLAATDALTGLIVQPSFILWKISQLLVVGNSEGISNIHKACLNTVGTSSSYVGYFWKAFSD